MKKFKRAFTLAELLLCIGIIGIVSAMGMVITKHTTDKAYQLYYYTGYINLYNAIAEAKLQGATNATETMSKAMDLLKVDNTTSASAGINVASNCDLNLLSFKAVYRVEFGEPELNRPGEGNPSNAITGSFKDNLGKDNNEKFQSMLTIPGGGGGSNNNTTANKTETNENETTTPKHDLNIQPIALSTEIKTVECSNGITYSYNIPRAVNNSETYDASKVIADLGDLGDYTRFKNVFITMRVPAAKTRTNGGFQEVRLYYSYDSNTLIPLAPEEGSTAPDLQTRRDLLPAYIDDGKVGRNNVVDRTNFTYEKPIYGSFKDAFCSLKGAGYTETYTGKDRELNHGTITIISCANNTYTDIRKTVNGTRVNGVLKIASPQKAH